MLIKTQTDFDDIEEIPFDPSQVKLYYVNAEMSDTDQEKKEMAIAFREQVELGIIHPNGIPVGINPNILSQPTKLIDNNYKILKKNNQTLYNKFGLRK